MASNTAGACGCTKAAAKAAALQTIIRANKGLSKTDIRTNKGLSKTITQTII
jgi:hypothetical protein